ncbi:hypothetical protein BH10CHL1_BH10CHL1_47770 [soil metagenome]
MNALTKTIAHTNGTIQKNGSTGTEESAEPYIIAGFIDLPANLDKAKMKIWLMKNTADFTTLSDDELQIVAVEINDLAKIPQSWLEETWVDMVRKARQATATEQQSDDGQITSKSYSDAVQKLRYVIGMNDLDDTIEANGEKFSDGIEAEILMKMHDLGFKRAEWVKRSITATAHTNRYHPIKDFLNKVEWDGNDWLLKFERFVWDAHPKIQYADGSVIPVFGAWLRRWGIGAVAKILQDGKLRGQNPMLVFAGNQNVGKSTLARFINPLSDEFFIESSINPDSKDHDRYLATKFIWEVAELGATARKADREGLKSFLTRQDVTFRTPYAHHPVTKPATANFIGTINPETGFLNDPTGHRRFLPVEITRIDFNYLTQIDCHQLWAQFVALYKAGESAALTPEEMSMADSIRSDQEMEDNYSGFILKFYDIGPSQSEMTETTTDIVEQLLINEVPNVNVTNIGLSLKRLGLDNKRVGREKVTTWSGIQRNDMGLKKRL